MIIPTVLNRASWFYAVGNTPATNLTRTVPNGVDASVLSLGCGDLRNLLFTCYMQQGLAERKVDFTLCDYDESVLARNLMLLTLIIDGEKYVSSDELWDAYYALRLTDSLNKRIHHHASRLLSLLETSGSWRAGKYCAYIQFCDEDTRKDVAAKITLIRDASRADKDESISSLRRNLATARRYGALALGGRLGEDGLSTNCTGVRSAGPCSMQAFDDVVKTYREYWEDVEPQNPTSKGTNGEMMPNAMIAGLLSDCHPLHYGSDPTNGFHTATAYAPLVEGSPMAINHKGSQSKLVAAAQVQFAAWVSAYRASYKRLFTVNMVIADVFAFAHTLQHALSTGDTCAGWYRRQLDPKPLRLDEQIYGKGRHSSHRFDVVDTSNLADHFGALNILVATAPLLKDEPWATITTELLIRRSSSQKEVVEKLLCGHWPTMSLLLGVNPIQLWTNAQVESPMEDFFLQLMTKPEKGKGIPGQMHSRMAWKRNDQAHSEAAKGAKTNFDAEELAVFLSGVYWRMCSNENSDSERQEAPAYPYHHNGSFVALMRAVKHAASTEWETFFPRLLDRISHAEREETSDGTLQQDLLSQLQTQGLWTAPCVSLEKLPDVEPFQGWRKPASAVAVTVAVPKSHVSVLFSGREIQKFAPPVIYGRVQIGREAHKFPCVHLAWGSIMRAPPASSENPCTTIMEDNGGFEGDSPLLASFMVPTSLLLKDTYLVKVKICLLDVANGAALYAPTIGPSLELFEARLLDESMVYVSEHLPGQTTHCSLASRFESGDGPVRLETENGFQKSTATIENAPRQKITTITTSMDITSEKGKRLLKEKCSVTLRTTDTPYVIDLCFGKDEMVLRELFPLPVDDAGAKTRIARTSGWVEVTVSLAEPLETKSLQPFIFPAGLNTSSIPTSLNMQCLNLDRLPVIDVNGSKKQLKWLTTLGSIQWSPREKKIRSAGQQNPASPADILRVNFKESLFTIMMVASGLQGEQTGLFTLQNPDRGGAHMLLLVSAFRLDGDTRSVVMDGAVIPLTMELITSGEIQNFLLFIQTLKSVSINVDDDELALWKMVIPSMVERCRTWSHLPSCEYKSPGATIPLSTGFGEQLLCSCGNGQLPSGFVSVPEWEEAAPHAVRIALSPLFAVQYVEELFDSSETGQRVDTAHDSCERCGLSESSLGKKLLRCSGCKDVKYCSVECQKKDWKVHKMDCREK